MSENKHGKSSKAKLGFFSALFMSLGSIIGAGIFASTPVAIKIVGGPGIVIGFLCGALFLLFKELPDVLMTSVLPANAGGYMMATRLVHPVFGMINAFSLLLTGTLKIATLGITFSTYFCVLFPSIAPMLVTVTCIVVFTILSLFGLRASAQIQNIAVIILVVALFIYIFLGMPGNQLSLRDILLPTVQLTRLWAAIGILHGSLYGADCLMYMAEDIKKPRTMIPTVYLVATFGCAIMYGFVAWVTAGGRIPFYQIQTLAQVAETFMGPGMLAFFISGGALLAVVTSINAVMLMFSRSTFVPARDGFYPKVITKVNKYGSPQNAIILNSIIALLLVFSGLNLGEATMMTTVPGTLLMPFSYIPIYMIMRHYPLSFKKNYFHSPHWAASLFAIVLTIFSLVTGWSVFIMMSKRNYILLAIYFGFALIYSYFRVVYLKRKGVNLIKDMKKPYEPWEKHEAILREAQAAKAAQTAAK